MILLLALGCVHANGPDDFRSLARGFDLRVTPAEVERALALAAANGVRPTRDLDLTGSWTITPTPTGNGWGMEGPVERQQIGPGLMAFAVVTVTTIDAKPIAALAAKGIEVFGDDRLCILWLEAEQSYQDGSEEARGLAAWSTVEKLNSIPCGNAILALTADRAQLRQGEVTYEERRFD